MFDKHKGKKQQPPRMGEPSMTKSPSTSPSTPAAPAGRSAVIGPGIVIEGNISGTDNLLIEGKVKGHIQLLANEVTVGQSGDVNADVSAKVIRVAGKVRGDLAGKEKVIISSTGNVQGNIVAPRMSLEDGAVFKGSIDMDPGESPAAKAVPAAEQAAVKPAAGAEVAAKGPNLALKSG